MSFDCESSLGGINSSYFPRILTSVPEFINNVYYCTEFVSIQCTTDFLISLIVFCDNIFSFSPGISNILISVCLILVLDLDVCDFQRTSNKSER